VAEARALGSGGTRLDRDTARWSTRIAAQPRVAPAPLCAPNKPLARAPRGRALAAGSWRSAP